MFSSGLVLVLLLDFLIFFFPASGKETLSNTSNENALEYDKGFLKFCFVGFLYVERF